MLGNWTRVSGKAGERNNHYNIVVEVEGVIDVHYASLTSQGILSRWSPIQISTPSNGA